MSIARGELKRGDVISGFENQRSESNNLPLQTEVVIVGGGLSGKALASALGSRVSHVVLDSRKSSEPKEAMYLVTTSIGKNWGIDQNDRERRNIVTSCVWTNPQGEIVEQLVTSGKDEGFAITPQTYLERLLPVDQNNIFYQTTCLKVEDDRNKTGVEVHTNRGDIHAKLVIDATGWEGNIIHQYYGSEDYRMAAIYGGNYRTEGVDPSTMYFIRGLKQNNKNWIMPISDHGAEVVSAQQLMRSQVRSWWEHAEEEFAGMVSLHESQGRRIINNKQGRRMGFRLEPAKKRFYRGRVVPFGEAAGLNSPQIGQLIDTLPNYTDRIAQIIFSAKHKDAWNSVGTEFYKQFIHNAPFSYLIHSVMRDNSIKLRRGYPRINTKLTQSLQDVLSEDKLWSTLRDNGLNRSDMMAVIKAHPIEIAQFIIASIPSLASILLHNPELYVQAINGLLRRSKRAKG